jgi:hypothetical protein
VVSRRRRDVADRRVALLELEGEAAGQRVSITSTETGFTARKASSSSRRSCEAATAAHTMLKIAPVQPFLAPHHLSDDLA